MKIRLIPAVIAVSAALIIAAVATIAVSALRQPDTADFVRLDYQRQAVDTSMNVYVPLFSGYTAEYANVFTEKRSADEQAALKAQYGETLETETKVNRDRLDGMRASTALKEPEVKSAFATYDKAYQAVIDYYEQYAVNVANISESVAGKCDLNRDLNVASATLAEDYTKAADVCLTALAEAKEGSDEPTKKLLTDVESLVKNRRDAFKKAIDKEGFEQTYTRLSALITLLSINTELNTIQTEYETVVKANYTELVDDANDANQALKRTLEDRIKGKKREA